eukprot:scaffold64270_cov36-Phaeocystis_antarctica.AAC.1
MRSAAALGELWSTGYRSDGCRGRLRGAGCRPAACSRAWAGRRGPTRAQRNGLPCRSQRAACSCRHCRRPVQACSSPIARPTRGRLARLPAQALAPLATRRAAGSSAGSSPRSPAASPAAAVRAPPPSRAAPHTRPAAPDTARTARTPPCTPQGPPASTAGHPVGPW